jgi:hypothetical protein
VEDCCEYGDEPSGSGATELVFTRVFNDCYAGICSKKIGPTDIFQGPTCFLINPHGDS